MEEEKKLKGGGRIVQNRVPTFASDFLCSARWTSGFISVRYQPIEWSGCGTRDVAGPYGSPFMMSLGS